MSVCECRCPICQAHQAGACCRDFRTSEHPYTFTPKAMPTPEPLSPSPEIRCKVLEDALREVHAYAVHGCGTKQKDARGFQFGKIVGICIAALAPETALTDGPEIRYQLRNWHHVNCAGFGGQACNCLAQREALIAELDQFGGRKK